MSEVKVKDFPGLLKVDSSFIVNTDETEYSRAVRRVADRKERKTLVKRVETLEEKLDTIIGLLKKATT